MAARKITFGTELPPSPEVGDAHIHLGAVDPFSVCTVVGEWSSLPGPFDFADATVPTSVDYTTLVNDLMILVDPTPNDVTITLIDGATVKQPVIVKHSALAVAGKRVFVQGSGGDLIDGEVSFEIQFKDSMSVAFKNGAWAAF